MLRDNARRATPFLRILPRRPHSRYRHWSSTYVGCSCGRVAVAAPRVRVVALGSPERLSPFDRILIAQAVAEGLDFVTNDESISEYSVRTIWWDLCSVGIPRVDATIRPVGSRRPAWSTTCPPSCKKTAR